LLRFDFSFLHRLWRRALALAFSIGAGLGRVLRIGGRGGWLWQGVFRQARMAVRAMIEARAFLEKGKPSASGVCECVIPLIPSPIWADASVAGTPAGLRSGRGGLRVDLLRHIGPDLLPHPAGQAFDRSS